MPSSLPPYALDLTSFHFPALAALAGRAPLGGAREAALAALLVARLIAQAGTLAHDPEARAERGTMARQWLAGVTLPAASRAALGRAIDAASRAATPAALRGAAEGVLSAVGPLLDPAGRGELQQLAQSLEP